MAFYVFDTINLCVCISSWTNFPNVLPHDFSWNPFLVLQSNYLTRVRNGCWANQVRFHTTICASSTYFGILLLFLNQFVFVVLLCNQTKISIFVVVVANSIVEIQRKRDTLSELNGRQNTIFPSDTNMWDSILTNNVGLWVCMCANKLQRI